jgi:hypothetical protein
LGKLALFNLFSISPSGAESSVGDFQRSATSAKIVSGFPLETNRSMIAQARPPGPPAIRDGYDRWPLVYDYDANLLLALEEAFVREQLGSAERINNNEKSKPESCHLSSSSSNWGGSL